MQSASVYWRASLCVVGDPKNIGTKSGSNKACLPPATNCALDGGSGRAYKCPELKKRIQRYGANSVVAKDVWTSYA